VLFSSSPTSSPLSPRLVLLGGEFLRQRAHREDFRRQAAPLNRKGRHPFLDTRPLFPPQLPFPPPSSFISRVPTRSWPPACGSEMHVRCYRLKPSSRIDTTFSFPFLLFFLVLDTYLPVFPPSFANKTLGRSRPRTSDYSTLTPCPRHYPLGLISFLPRPSTSRHLQL